MGKKTVFMLNTPNGKERVDAEQSKFPITPSEHHIGYFTMLAIMTAGAIASWAFVTGGSIGVMIPANYGACAAFFGCTVSFMAICYPACVYTRYGTDMSVVGRSVWGHRGAYVMILGLGFISTYGWGSLPIVMLGKSTSTILQSAGITGTIGTSWQIWSIVALIIGLLITYYGTSVIDKVSSIAAPIVVILLLFICVVLAKEYGFHEAFTRIPDGVDNNRETLVRNYMLAVEIALGVGFSWPFYMSAYSKPCLTENAAYTPSILGSGVVWGICCIAPMITAAMTGETDPVIALGKIGGGFVVIWMVMLMFANLSSVMVNPYFLSSSMHAMFPKLKWKYCVLMQALYLVPILFPIFYDKFGAVIAFIGMIEAPAGVVWAVSFFLQKKINLRHCYAKGENLKRSAYWYQGGFNLSAWVSVAIGAAFGYWLYGPYSGEIRWEGFFDLFGAMFPAAILSGVIYIVLYKIQCRTWKHPGLRMTVEEYAAEK